MINISIVAEDEQLIPNYAHPADAGADLRSSVYDTIFAGERLIVPTGIKIDIPDGYVGLIHPRSGLAAKHGITVLNTPGTIDSGYQGEIKVILFNASTEPFSIAKYDRIAQIVFQRFEPAQFVSDAFASTTLRSNNGFGSTGVN